MSGVVLSSVVYNQWDTEILIVIVFGSVKVCNWPRASGLFITQVTQSPPRADLSEPCLRGVADINHA
jgi:hypothetical protein